MSNLRKYLVLAGVLMLIPACANAEISVKDTTSAEFIYNAGYSTDMKRIIDVKTKNPATPIPAKEENYARKNFGWYVLENLLDPAVDRPHSFADHDIPMYNSIDDL